MLAKICFHMLEIRETKRVFHARLWFSTIIADLCLGLAPIYFSFRSDNSYNSHCFSMFPPKPSETFAAGIVVYDYTASCSTLVQYVAVI